MPSRTRYINSPVSLTNLAIRKDKGILGFMRDFLNSNKQPEISRPYDLVHLTHVGIDSSTGEFTGLPKTWHQFLQDSEISKSDQEKDLLAVTEIVKLYYQEGGGDVWDRMDHALVPGSSRSPPMIPGAAHVAYPGVSESVGDGFVPMVSAFLCGSSLVPHHHLLTIQSTRRCRL